ncbi:hypothetical protein LWI29_014186 [Acer saccharum]|uniref:Protein FAR1-RELATED SEQUENCE n=1 Tax=Acer saccharum TaxID=4024 RepID=A0AA39T3D0_ACESA|nr:hypothetical protein LWI29_014186 [Acer saccharum]
MGNGEEHPSTLTPCNSNPPSVEFNKDRPNPQKMEDCSSKTRQNVEIDGDDMIEEPKKGMEFNSLEDLLSYYKSYGKKCGFGVITKRTERGEDKIVRYVTLACSHGGNARNRTLSVVKCPTGRRNCMDGITPKAIITDQDRAMKNAIAIVFPTTRHRFYLWHILKKVPEKLGSYKTEMKSALMKSIYDNQSVEEFETS